MALKELLGLESFHLSEREIISAINDARIKQKSEVVFSSNSKRVVVGVSSVNSLGIMRDTWRIGKSKNW